MKKRNTKLKFDLNGAVDSVMIVPVAPYIDGYNKSDGATVPIKPWIHESCWFSKSGKTLFWYENDCISSFRLKGDYWYCLNGSKQKWEIFLVWGPSHSQS